MVIYQVDIVLNLLLYTSEPQNNQGSNKSMKTNTLIPKGILTLMLLVSSVFADVTFLHGRGSLSMEGPGYINAGKTINMSNCRVSSRIFARGTHELTFNDGNQKFVINLHNRDGQRLEQGVYLATRSPFNEEFHGFSLSGEGRCNNRLLAAFTISSVGYLKSGQLAHLSGQFVQHDEQKGYMYCSGVFSFRLQTD